MYQNTAAAAYPGYFTRSSTKCYEISAEFLSTVISGIGRFLVAYNSHAKYKTGQTLVVRISHIYLVTVSCEFVA